MSYYPLSPTDLEYSDMEYFECPYDHQCNGCEFDCDEDYKEAKTMSFRVIHKDDNRGCALIQPVHGGRSIPVVMADWLRNMVCVGDWATITQSPVTGELVLSDYARYIDEVGE